MEHKTWLWRRRSSEKFDVFRKDSASLKENGNELHDAKEDPATINANILEYAIAGRAEAEAEAETLSLKQELKKALVAATAANDKLAESDVSLQDCKRQLASVQQEADQKVQSAVQKKSTDLEKLHKVLETKLLEASRRVETLASTNLHLNKALQDRDGLTKNLQETKSELEADLKTLIGKVAFMENESIFLKYEFRMLEKEIEIRNEEREFNRSYIDELRKQQVDNVKKLTQLESECTRLRGIVRKQGGGRGNSNTIIHRPPENHRLSNVEKENKILKEIISEKNNEIHDMRTSYDQNMLKLAQNELQIEELSRGFSPKSNELTPVAGFKDGISSSGSAKGPREQTKLGVAEMCLLDDFVEMEKLAIVSIDKELESNLQIVPVTGSGLLIDQLEESNKCVETLRTELEMVKVSKGEYEDQMVKQNSINENLEAKLKEVLEKFSSLEVDYENKCIACEELEATCLDLQLQLERAGKDFSQNSPAEETKQMQNDREIITASMKLAKCQESIVSIGKQLNSLASNRESALLEKATSTNNTMDTNKPSSLYNKMIAEDDAKTDAQKPQTTKELGISIYKKHPPVLTCKSCKGSGPIVIVDPQRPYFSNNKLGNGGTIEDMAIVTHKKQKGGSGFLKKLLLRRKKASMKKTSLTFGIV